MIKIRIFKCVQNYEKKKVFFLFFEGGMTGTIFERNFFNFIREKSQKNYDQNYFI